MNECVTPVAGEWKVLLDCWLHDGSFDRLLPEVAALRGVPQDGVHHPEGDVYHHTLQAVAAVADDDDQRVFWAVLLHDIGKKTTTELRDGRWRSLGHAQAGAELVPGILARFGLDSLAADVRWLVRHHLYRLSWNIGPGMPLTRRQEGFTQQPLFPLLERVCEADRAGRQGR